MKKSLLLTPFILAAMATPAYIVYMHPKIVTKEVPVVVTKTITNTAPIPVYHVGDTQDGVTLVGVYHYDYQDMMGGNGPTPPIVHLVYFAVSGVSELAGRTQVLTSDGTYLAPNGPSTIPACGTNPCVGYIDSSQPVSFYYKDLKWQL